MNRKDYVTKINEEYNKLDKRAPVEKFERIILAGAYYKKFMELTNVPLDQDDNKETPYRVAKMFYEELNYALFNPAPKITLFKNTGYDEYLVVTGIKYYSMCSHHHIPFFGEVSIAYHPDKKIVGLSKFARIAKYFAKKPQTQENLTHEIIDYLYKEIKPVGIMVRVSGRHLCMEARGAKALGSKTVTSAIRGDIDKDEILKLMNKQY